MAHTGPSRAAVAASTCTVSASPALARVADDDLSEPRVSRGQGRETADRAVGK